MKQFEEFSGKLRKFSAILSIDHRETHQAGLASSKTGFSSRVPEITVFPSGWSTADPVLRTGFLSQMLSGLAVELCFLLNAIRDNGLIPLQPEVRRDEETARRVTPSSKDPSWGLE